MGQRRVRKWGARTLSVLGSLAAAAALPTAASATEVTVQNDSFVSGGPAFIVGDFGIFEQAGARLTSPCDGTIVAVQVAWLDFFGTSDATVEEAIHIFADGSFPFPGSELAFLEGPVMTPGALNEFRTVDDLGTPLAVPVDKGDRFYVTLEFANPTDILQGTSSVIRDLDGCTSGSNVLFAIPGGWIDFCTIISGDLVIRAVIDCESLSLGGCCLPSDCLDSLTQTDCVDFGGSWIGPDTDCTGSPCPGACCLPSGDCSVETGDDCITGGGTFTAFEDCADVECADPVGACCIPATGGCLDRTEDDCAVFAGVWSGGGTECASFVCFPEGACCLPDGSCNDASTLDDCTASGGTFQGDMTECSTSKCPAPTGACCIGATSLCSVETEADCGIGGGTWQGAGTDCTDGDKTGTADACESSCPADIDGDGEVAFTDLLSVLSQWGPCPGCPEDIDEDDDVGFTDLLAVLSSWGPC